MLHPQFHVGPATNWLNDPNGPMYDPKHKLYHLFWQYNPWGAVWGNMSWGHAVSTDLAHWSHLPVAMYNDKPYDVDGVYSGSVTMVEGVPMATYTCVGPNGQRQCLAWPTNMSDPYYTNWTKSPQNPIISKLPPGCNGDFRDDTTAWKDSATNQWLMGVGANLGGNASIVLYRSKDFKSWSLSNVLWQAPGAGMWECPDFFPLDGSNGLYVAKHSSGGQDWYAIGHYDTTSHTFTPDVATDTLYDAGHFYASKTFRDPVGAQQVLWGWVSEEDSSGPSRGWQGCESLPRAITYDADLQKLNIEPVSALAGLRTTPYGNFDSFWVSPNSMTPLPSTYGTQLEIDADFNLPNVDPGMSTSFGIAVLVSNAGSQTRAGVTVTGASGPLNDTDLPGGDLTNAAMDPSLPDDVNAANCSALCNASAVCSSWTFVRNGTAPSPGLPDCRCSLKSGVPAAVSSKPCCISGILGGTWAHIDRTRTGGDGPANIVSGRFAMKPGEATVRLHVFVDHSIVELFVQGGRASVTARVYPADPGSSVMTGAYVSGYGTGVQFNSANYWTIDSIWTPLERV